MDKSPHCQTCKIKLCAQEHNLEMCVDCASFPCEKIKHIDKRYRLRYRQSLIDNAVRLRTIGPELYLREERQRWLCADCGGVISLHDWACSECGKAV